MIRLEPFKESDFNTFIRWIDSKELLVQIAGLVFTYPPTHDQLQKYLDDKKSHAFNIVDTMSNKIIGHSEIIVVNDMMCKLDKVIIGDPSARGKGIGLQIMQELLKHSFEKLNAQIVELNVYDWNIAGLKCYEKAGFTLNPDKKQLTQLEGVTWTALNMIIHREKWLSIQQESVADK